MSAIDEFHWGELYHAYGKAADIVPLLQTLSSFPSEERPDTEPWHTLWGIQAYIVTTIGKQVLRLGKFAPHERYLRAVGTELKKAGATVDIADYTDVGENQIQTSNATQL
jgi:hypothetical protein